MSVDRNAEEQVDVEIDVEGDTLEIERKERETVRIDQLFQPVDNDNCDARLILWTDSAGWNGYERRDGEFYRVNVLTDTYVDGSDYVVESTYVDDVHADPAEVAKSIRDHIDDPYAGGEGQFARGCSPP